MRYLAIIFLSLTLVGCSRPNEWLLVGDMPHVESKTLADRPQRFRATFRHEGECMQEKTHLEVLAVLSGQAIYVTCSPRALSFDDYLRKWWL